MAHGMASEPARRPARTGVASTLIASTLFAGTLIAATACGAGRTDIVVVLKPDATPADADRIRASCDGLPHVRAAAPDTTATATAKRYPVRFSVIGGSAEDKNRLYQCLTRDPAVTGASETES